MFEKVPLLSGEQAVHLHAWPLATSLTSQLIAQTHISSVFLAKYEYPFVLAYSLTKPLKNESNVCHICWIRKRQLRTEMHDLLRITLL